MVGRLGLSRSPLAVTSVECRCRGGAGVQEDGEGGGRRGCAQRVTSHTYVLSVSYGGH